MTGHEASDGRRKVSGAGVRRRLVVSLLAALGSTAATIAAQPAPAGIGVEVWSLTASDRAYGDPPGARPVRAVVWYPARSAAAGQPVTIATLARAGWVSSDTAAPGSDRPADVRRAFERDVREMAPSAVSTAALRTWYGSPTRARWAAPPAGGRHAAVLVVSGATARPYFHVALAERLAGAGFVVAQVLPLGAGPGAVPSFDAAGIDTAAHDAAVVLDRVRIDPRVEATRVGTLAWSVGGVTALRLQRLRPGAVAAGVSLDSGAGYDYGPPLLSAADAPALAAARTPLLHVWAGVPNRVMRDRSLLAALGAEFHTADGLRHADFASVAWVGREPGEAVAALEARVESFFADRLQARAR